MAVLSYNEITQKKVIVYDGQPYEVLSSHVFRMQQRKPVNQTKLRHLVTAKVLEISFHQSETVQEADISTMKANYLYTNRGDSWFAEEGNAKNRFAFPEDAVGDRVKWLVANSPVDVLMFNDEPVTISIPIKMELKVVEAPPSLRGDTATGGDKKVKLESGAVVSTPLFISEGDVLRVNTDTGEYVERVTKA